MSLYLPNISMDNAGLAFVASVITLVPSLLVFLAGQNYLEQGIAASDEEVVLAASEWINEAVSRVDIGYDFLLENLWWPGFKMTSPKITGLMLDKINYPKKGIMLDTGHLLHTNLILEDENQGMEYINKCLDEQG